jgi:hypothetical protein
MLPSRATIGDVIHFAFPHLTGRVVTGFQVMINGKRVKAPEIVTSRSKSGGTAIFVFRVSKPGIYQFVITPIDQAGVKGEPRLNTVEVPEQSLGSLK